MEQDKVFSALADESRRKLLDLLFEQDGRTLSDLEAYLPMTRFGCMKHLKILEEAGLLTTRKVGREKHHYLNPVPIQLVYDRWVSKYAQPWTQALTGLKYTLESKNMSEKYSHVFEIYIRTSPEQLWQALTDGTITPNYYFGSRVEASWKPHSTYRYPNPAGGSFVEGEVLEVEPLRKLVLTFQPLWLGEAESHRLSKITWEIEPRGAVCKLTLTHAGLEPNSTTTRTFLKGWGQILSSLKTFLETGEPLVL